MTTILSEKLLTEVLDHHKEFSKYSFVVKPSIPILFFGDLIRYSKQSFKVVTVGLNPSDNEFREKRFPEFRNSPYSLELSLTNYFKKKPYEKWFNWYEKYLNGLGCSYYRGNKVIHTDICSPLATNPTWGHLDKEDQVSDIENTELLFSHGFLIWKKLITELKPNLIIISVGKKYFDKLNPKPKLIRPIYSKKYTIDNKTLRPQDQFNLELFTVNIDGHTTNLIYGNPYKGSPFGIVENIKRTKMGEETLKYI